MIKDRPVYRSCFLLIAVLIFGACKEQAAEKSPANLLACHKLRPLSRSKPAPKPGDWLYDRLEEVPQSLKQYVISKPLLADDIRNKLYLVQLGPFDANERAIFTAVQEYLSIYLQIATDTIAALPTDIVPAAHQRIHHNVQQLRTGHILNELLPPLKPSDALALIAFSAQDLYPDPEWNFVFGQAKLSEGVGIWSLARL